MSNLTGGKIISPYRNLAGLNSYSGIWHSHIMGNFPGFVQAREICRCGNYGFLGVTEHDNRYSTIGWSEKDWYEVNDHDFLVIRGFEATHPLGHISCLGFLPEQTGVDAMAAFKIRFEKKSLDAGYEGFLRRASELGAFLAINHPHKWRGRAAELLAYPDFSCLDAIEIYNGNQVGKSLEQGYTVDLYDDCLGRGARIWAGANPDCHSWDIAQADGPFNGYSVVLADNLSREAILHSLKQGRFYASTGLQVDLLEVDDVAYRVAAPGSRRISFLGRNGRLLEQFERDQASYRFRGDEGYVRVQLEGDSGSRLRVGERPAEAWLQPAWVD